MDINSDDEGLIRVLKYKGRRLSIAGPECHNAMYKNNYFFLSCVWKTIRKSFTQLGYLSH